MKIKIRFTHEIFPRRLRAWPWETPWRCRDLNTCTGLCYPGHQLQVGHIIGISPQSLLQFAISVHTIAIAASGKFKESPRQLKSGARLRLGAGLPGGRPPDNIKLRSRRTLNFSPSSSSPLPSASPGHGADTRNWQPAARVETSTGSGT